RAEVEALLAADAAASGLDAPAADRAAGLVEDAPEDRAGERVGPWVIEREIGRGGMGAVYLVARADGAFKQTAALKRVSMAGPGRTRRFVQERQILAGLDHEGIARLIDGGVADDGTPYLVMEHVEGEPITAYADRHRLGVEDRVRLFAQVCDAVGHAHRHLVVHRDLKPSNVFVGGGEKGLGVGASGDRQAPDPRPQSPIPKPQASRVKLLDFGIAKLLDEAEGPETTRTGLPNLTPEYAAPEQVTGAPVTTATDVYALGVLLYELLAGRRPYAIERPTLAGIVDTLRTAQPGPPSAAAPEAGRRALRGDLDTITLKALAKEPERRYRSADELGDDLRRHLGGLPVEARAPTPAYRIGRFVRRHTAGVAATAIGVLLLVAGASFYTVRLAAERDRATLAATRAERTADFLELIFAGSDPTGQTDPGETTARTLLDLGAAQAREELAEEPVVLAGMLATIGRVYRAVGLYPDAEPALRDALALYDSTGADPLGQRDALLQLANLQYRTEAYDESGRLAREALRLDSLHARPEESSRLEILNTVALVHSDLGDIHDDPAELETAARILEEVVAGRRALDTEEARVDLGVNLSNLGLIYMDLGRYDEAEPLLDESIVITEAVRGPEHPYVAFALNSRAGVYEVRRDFARAVADMEQAVEIGEASLGPEHPFTLYARGNLGELIAKRDSLGS
ncbi:MAG: serine/threonine-protein kinase, partial [Bacteroidota bacterium]